MKKEDLIHGLIITTPITIPLDMYGAGLNLPFCLSIGITIAGIFYILYNKETK